MQGCGAYTIKEVTYVTLIENWCTNESFLILTQAFDMWKKRSIYSQSLLFKVIIKVCLAFSGIIRPHTQH